MADFSLKLGELHLVRVKDLPLVRAADAKVYTTERGHFVEGDIVEAITVVRQVSYRSGKQPVEIMRRLKVAGFVSAVGKFGRTGELDAFEVNHTLAKICGVTFVIGPIKCHPDGALEIRVPIRDLDTHPHTRRERGHEVGQVEWTPATDELLAALQTETALGLKQTPAHLAAEIITKWRATKWRASEKA